MITVWNLTLISDEGTTSYRGIDSKELLGHVEKVCSDPDPDRYLMTFAPADGTKAHHESWSPLELATALDEIEEI